MERMMRIRSLPILFKFHSFKWLILYAIIVEAMFYQYAYSNDRVSEFYSTLTTYTNPISWFIASLLLKFLLPRIKKLLGIDLTKKSSQSISSGDSEIQEMFNEENFSEYQLDCINLLYSKKINFWGILIGATGSLIFHATIVYNDGIDSIGLYGIPVWLNLNTILFNILYTIFDIWIVSITFSTILLGVQIVSCVSLIGENHSLLKMGILNDHIKALLSRNLENRKLDLDVLQFSIKGLKRKAQPIPNFMIKVSIMLLIGVALLSITMALIALQVNTVARSTVYIFDILFTLVGIILCFIVFIVPQKSIHNLIQIIKSGMIEVLEIGQEKIRLRFLKEQGADVESLNLREKLGNEFIIIGQMIDDIETVFTWPFNYSQLLQIGLSAVGAIAVPMIFVLIENYLTLISV